MTRQSAVCYHRRCLTRIAWAEFEGNSCTTPNSNSKLWPTLRNISPNKTKPYRLLCSLPLVRNSPTQCAVVCCVRSIELLHISMRASLLYQTVHFLSLSDFLLMSFSHQVKVTLSTFNNRVRRHLYNLKMISSFNCRMLSKDLVIFVLLSVSVVLIWPSYHPYAFLHMSFISISTYDIVPFLTFCTSQFIRLVFVCSPYIAISPSQWL